MRLILLLIITAFLSSCAGGTGLISVYEAQSDTPRISDRNVVCANASVYGPTTPREAQGVLAGAYDLAVHKAFYSNSELPTNSFDRVEQVAKDKAALIECSKTNPLEGKKVIIGSSSALGTWHPEKNAADFKIDSDYLYLDNIAGTLIVHTDIHKKYPGHIILNPDEARNLYRDLDAVRVYNPTFSTMDIYNPNRNTHQPLAKGSTVKYEIVGTLHNIRPSTLGAPGSIHQTSQMDLAISEIFIFNDNDKVLIKHYQFDGVNNATPK